MALSKEPIPAPFFDAVTACEAESAEMEFRTNKARVHAQVRHR